jgi:hypothetical protein
MTKPDVLPLIPHSDIRSTLIDTVDVLEHLSQKYEMEFEEQQTTIYNLEGKNKNNKSLELKDLIDKCDETSYKLNNLYFALDLINDSPWMNPKHKLHKGTLNGHERQGV